MIALLAIHLGTNYLAVRAVSMRTLNRQRANLVFSAMFDVIYDKLHAPKAQLSKNPNLSSIIPSPEQISAVERVFEKDGVLRWKAAKPLGYCEIGVDLRMILNSLGKPNALGRSYSGIPSSQVSKLLDLYKDDGYILWYDEPRKTFLIVLKDSADTTTHLQAWMHALYHAKASELGRLEEAETLIDSLASTKDYVTKVLDRLAIFEELQKAGWDIETGAMETKSGTRIKLTGS